MRIRWWWWWRRRRQTKRLRMFSDCLLGMCAEDQLQFNISLWTRSSQSLDHLDLTRMPLAEKKTEGKHVLFCSVRGSLRSPNSRSAEAATKLQPASNGTHVASQFGWCWCLPQQPSSRANHRIERMPSSWGKGLAWHRFPSDRVSENHNPAPKAEIHSPKACAKDTETPTWKRSDLRTNQAESSRKIFGNRLRTF